MSSGYRYFHVRMPRNWDAYFRTDESAPEGQQVRQLVDGLWEPYEPFPAASTFLSNWGVHLTEITATDVPCPGCAMIVGEATRIVVRNWPDAVAIKPRPAPLVVGHTLVLPKTHVIDAAESPMITGMVTSRASELAAEMWGTNFCMMINSGSLADQTLFHLHCHIWPRRRGDGMGGPWAAQQQPRSLPEGGSGQAGSAAAFQAALPDRAGVEPAVSDDTVAAPPAPSNPAGAAPKNVPPRPPGLPPQSRVGGAADRTVPPTRLHATVRGV